MEKMFGINDAEYIRVKSLFNDETPVVDESDIIVYEDEFEDFDEYTEEDDIAVDKICVGIVACLAIYCLFRFIPFVF